MVFKKFRAQNSHVFLGMGEWQVVREVINADLGKWGRFHRESALELSLRLGRMLMCGCGGRELASREQPGQRHRGGRVQVRIRK